MYNENPLSRVVLLPNSYLLSRRLLADPEANIRPGDGHRASAAVSGVSTNLVVEASGGSSVVTVSQRAVDVDSEALNVGVVDGVDGDACANRGSASRGNRSTALDAVERAVAVDAQDEVGAGAAVEGLLDGHLVAAKRVDLEGAGELVRARGVVVVVAVLSTQMAVGAARAAGAAVGARGDGEGAATGAASGARLQRGAGAGWIPGAALQGSGGHGHDGGRKADEDTLDKHFERDVDAVLVSINGGEA